MFYFDVFKFELKFLKFVVDLLMIFNLRANWCIMDCGERGSHIRSVHSTQDTSRSATTRMKHEKELSSRIIENNKKYMRKLRFIFLRSQTRPN